MISILWYNVNIKEAKLKAQADLLVNQYHSVICAKWCNDYLSVV